MVSPQQRRLTRALWIAACLLPLAGLGSSQEPAAEDGPASSLQPAETPAAALAALDSLEEYFREATRLYAAKVLPMREGPKRERAQRQYFPRPEVWAERFLRMVSKVPGSEAEARAWGWVVANAGETEHGPVAAAGLVREHLASPYAESLCERNSVATEAQLKAVFEGSPLGVVRARAGLELAERLLAAPADGGVAGQGAAAANRAREAQGVAVLEALESGLGGVRFGDRPVTAIASDRLYAWRHLRPGMVAPDITGSDLAGEPLAAWEAGGCRARVLVFWRTREMSREPGFGAVRALHARFESRGAQFAGVNGDRDTARAGRAAKLQRMPMPSLADGAQGGAAGIAYRVASWPSAVLLDGQGRIVQRDIGLAALPATLDAFLAAVESGDRKD